MTKEDKIERILQQRKEVHRVDYPQLLKEFNQHLKLTLDKTGNEHHFRNLNNLKILMKEDPDLDWQDLKQEDVKQLLVKIQERPVIEKTRNKYREALNKYLNMQEKDWKTMTPKGVTVYQGTEDSTTDPEKIPNPEEIKKFLREVEARSHPQTRLRNLAFFFTLWDTGARTSGLLKAPLNTEIHDQHVTVTVAPIKRSPKRKLDCFFASEILKKYLDNHPRPESGYLFPNLIEDRGKDAQNASNPREEEYLNSDTVRSMAKSIWKDLTESDVVEVKWRQQPLHIFRKSSKTWFDNMDLLNETDIDVRAGHVIGSQYTRVYTRKSDEDSNRNLRQNLGIDEEDDKDWKDVLWPKKCSNCSTRNSGHRNQCEICGKVMNQEDLPKDVDVKQEDKNQEIGQIKGLIKALDASGVDIDQEEVEKYL